MPPPSRDLPEPSGMSTPPLQTSAPVPFRWEEEPANPDPAPAPFVDPTRPTTVLDCLVEEGKSVFSSAPFRFPIRRHLHRLQQQRLLLESKTEQLKGTSASGRGDCVISPSSSSSKTQVSFEDTIVGEKKGKRMRRNESFSYISHLLNNLPQSQTTGVSPPMSNARKVPSATSLRDLVTRTRGNKAVSGLEPHLVDMINSVTRGNKAVTRGNKAVSGLEPHLVDMINSVIVDRSPSVKWEDIAGLEKAKQTLMEMVILPTKRNDLFTGLRRPAKGLLLFGPPGTGKTMLAKAVASETEATFFSVSASSLTSKWVGEGEKLVKTLFAVAVSRQPSVIFVDEIDSFLSARKSDEHEFSRRLKSEFLVQLDGVTSNSDDLVVVIGATNKPQEMDDAVLRRLVKRIYIPLPDAHVRRELLKHKLKGQAFSLPGGDLEKLVRDTEGYSGSDLKAVCEEAAMMPIRELGSNILTIKADQVRCLRYGDFQTAMTVIRPCLQNSKWEEVEQWNREFGSN